MKIKSEKTVVKCNQSSIVHWRIVSQTSLYGLENSDVSLIFSARAFIIAFAALEQL